MRFFYSLIRRVAAGRIRVAGTIGFGLWDSLWMSFSFAKARAMLHDDPQFVHTVFKHWAEYQRMAADAMLDAGIKLIFFRENPNGFPTAGGLAECLSPLVSDYYMHICESARARGGCVILDCDADDMIETGLPARWGFDGIGPLRFRDMEDLMAARKAIDERLYLIGSLAVPSGLESSSGIVKRSTGVMLASKPTWRARLSADEHDLLNEVSPLLADTGDSPTE
jgi:uroporphyrinogen-III decarboxylase